MSPLTAEVKFLFLFCNDCDAIAYFYKNILGLKVSGGEKEGFVNVQAGIELCFFKGDYKLDTPTEWAWQPGYKGGNGHFMSWAIDYSEKDFKEVVKNIQSSTVEIFESNVPVWRRDSYWAITVKDPMDNTIEIYHVPDKKPEILVWNEK